MLPSQSARPSSSRAHMYRRHRGRRIPVIIGMAVIIIGGIVTIKLWPGSTGPAPADAAPTPPSSTALKSTGPEPAMMTAPMQAPPKQPITLSQAPPKAETQPKVSMGQSSPPADQVPVNPERNKPTGGGGAGGAALAETPAKPPAAPPQNIAKPDASPTRTATDLSTSASPTAAAQRMNAGMDLLARNKPVEARKMLSDALATRGLSPADADRIRTALSDLNEKIVFGREVAGNDPFARVYTIESGDVIAKLPRKLSLNVDWRFLQRINDLADPQFIQVGQKIKVVTGPFHAIVHKPEFRLDLYMGNGDERVYVRSYTVGLGEFDATPEGVFAVRANSKLINPEWTNPRTGEHFYADDPNNPIGERWIGLVGVSENIRDLSGYGVHGTIDPDSIGAMKSMGCVRMKSDDVNTIYELLMENVSRVEIRGEDQP